MTKKTALSGFALFAFALCLYGTRVVFAGNPPLPPPDAKLDWWTVDTGASGHNTGGAANVLFGSIGQHDTGDAEASSSSLAAGFLSAFDSGTIQFKHSIRYISEEISIHYVEVERVGGDYNAAQATVSVTSATATPGEYSCATTTLTWAPNEMGTKLFPITLTSADSTPEPAKSISLSLSGISGAGKGLSETEVVILDDDTPVEVLIATTGFEFNEDDGEIPVEISLSSATAMTVNVDVLTSDVTTIAFQDYVPVLTTLTFAPGETAKQLSIPLIQDCSTEESEHFMLGLDNLVNATLHPGSIDYGLTITDGQPCAMIHIVGAPVHFDDHVLQGPSPFKTITIANIGNGPLSFIGLRIHLAGLRVSDFYLNPHVIEGNGFTPRDLASISLLGLNTTLQDQSSVFPGQTREVNIVHEPISSDASWKQVDLCVESDALNSNFECAIITAGHDMGQAASLGGSSSCAPQDFTWDLRSPEGKLVWKQDPIQLPFYFIDRIKGLKEDETAVMRNYFEAKRFRLVSLNAGFAFVNKFGPLDYFVGPNEKFLHEEPLHNTLALQSKLIPWALFQTPFTFATFFQNGSEFLDLQDNTCDDDSLSKLIRVRWTLLPKTRAEFHSGFRLRTFSEAHTRVDYAHFEEYFRFRSLGRPQDLTTYSVVNKANSSSEDDHSSKKRLGLTFDVLRPGDFGDALILQKVELVHISNVEYARKFVASDPTACPSEAVDTSGMYGKLLAWTPTQSSAFTFEQKAIEADRNVIRAQTAMDVTLPDVPCRLISPNKIEVLNPDPIQLPSHLVKTGSQIYLSYSTFEGFYRVTRIPQDPDIVGDTEKFWITTTGNGFAGFPASENFYVSLRRMATSSLLANSMPDYSIISVGQEVNGSIKLTLDSKTNLPHGAVIFVSQDSPELNQVFRVIDGGILDEIDDDILYVDSVGKTVPSGGTVAMAPHDVKKVSADPVAAQIKFNPADFSLEASNSGTANSDYSFAYVDIFQKCEHKVFNYIAGATYRVDVEVSSNKVPSADQIVKGIGLPALRLRTIQLGRTPENNGQLSHELWIQTNPKVSDLGSLTAPSLAGTKYSLYFTIPRDYKESESSAIALAFDMWTNNAAPEVENVKYTLQSLELHRAKPVPAQLVPPILSTTGGGEHATVKFTRLSSGEEGQNAIHRYEAEVDIDPSFPSGSFRGEVVVWKQPHPGTNHEETVIVSGLTPNTKYYARVRAIDVLDQAGSPSSTVEFTTYSLNPKVPSGPRPVPPVLNEERNHADPAALQTNYASVGSAWPLEASISDVSERTTTPGYPKNYLLSDDPDVPNFYSALVSQAIYDPDENFGSSPMLMGAFFGSSTLTESRNYITRAPRRAEIAATETQPLKAEQPKMDRYLNGAEVVGNILRGGTFYDRFQAIGLYSTAATGSVFEQNESVMSLTALKSRVEIGALPFAEPPLEGDTEARYDLRQFTQGRTSIGKGGWPSFLRGSSAYIYPEAFNDGDMEQSWEFGNKAGSYVDRAFARINEIKAYKEGVNSVGRVTIEKVVGIQSYLNMNNFHPHAVGEAGTLSSTVSINREIGAGSANSRSYVGMRIDSRLGPTSVDYSRPYQPVRNSVFVESQEPGSISASNIGTGSTVRFAPLLPDSADQRMPESTATILISDSVSIGDSKANKAQTTLNTDGLHVKGMVHLTPRNGPPLLNQDLAGFNKVGLLYFDASKNRLRLSRAAPIAGAAYNDKTKSHIQWASIQLEGGPPAENLPPSSQHPRVRLHGLVSGSTIHLSLEGFDALVESSPLPSVYARRRGDGVQGYGASGWNLIVQSTWIDADEMTCLLPSSITGASDGFSAPKPGQMVEVIVLKNAQQSAGLSFPLIEIGD